MDKTEMKKRADKLFTWFADNKFRYVYTAYAENVALVCEFEDWFKGLTDSDIAQELDLDEDDPSSAKTIQSFREMVLTGIDAWYGTGDNCVFA